jgi:hypothetical protein
MFGASLVIVIFSVPASYCVRRISPFLIAVAIGEE